MAQKESAQQANSALANTFYDGGEITNPYPASTWTVVAGISATFKTTRPNQQVVALTKLQTYQGGYPNFRYYLDGADIGTPMKVRTGINDTTTGMVVLYDWFTVPTAGSHTLQVRVRPDSNMRIIPGEGASKMSVLANG